MNKIVSTLVITGALAMASAANAADIARPVYKAPVVVPVVYNWSGFYVGGHAGGAWSDIDTRFDPLPTPALFGVNPIAVSHTNSGFIGGVHAGYNWQVQNWVLGVEGDWSWTDLGNSVTQTWTLFGTNAGVPTASTSLSPSLNSLATLRGRLGFLAAPQLLVYATGGAAWADMSLAATGINTLQPYITSASLSETRTGWVIGGGLEWLATNNWLFRVEYLYYDFGGSTNVVAEPTLPIFGAAKSGFSLNDANVQVLRGGISYKFDWSKAPVVAKY